MSTLPGTLPPRLKAVVEILDPETNALLADHILGNTSAEWLADTLARNGHAVSASTIRTYRRSLPQTGV